MANEKQRKTFLSYSRVNTDFAKKLAKELKAEGFPVWLDQLDIPAGSRWDREVEKALRECDIFMIILTPASIDSENVLDEIGYAIDTSKRLLPVLLENCEVPFRLRRFQYVDFTNKDFDDGLESAKNLLRGLIAQNTIPRGEVSAVSQDKQTEADTDGKAKEKADRLAGQKAEEDERIAKAKVETDRKAKEDADHLAAQKADADQLAKQKAKDERLAKIRAETERKEKEEADRLAAQKADLERLAKQKAEREPQAEADRKAKEKAKSQEAIPVEIKAETVSTAPTRKKPISRGLVIGAVAVVVLVIAGIGISALSNGGTPATEAPAATEAPIEAPVVSDSAGQVKGQDVNRVEYGKGSFYQAFVQGQSGAWFDVLIGDDGSYNETRYEEIGRDEWSVYLYDSTRNYNIQLDLYQGLVFEDFNDGNGEKQRDVIKGAFITPTGYAVHVVRHDGGEFDQTDSQSWVEKSASNSDIIYFTEVGRDEYSVYLYDESRNYTIHLDLYQKQIFLDKNDGSGEFSLYQILSAENQ